jgi:crotonobetainyl-CoA:carnitine CoA-transferase CaiB-like acyl-CoA transferase
MTTLPLAGYRVLELAHLVAGPACGMYLADMGADVVKIEQPAAGDASRTAYGTQLDGESAVFVTVNRYADLPRDPQVLASRLIVEQEHPRAGRFRTLDTPIRFEQTPGGIRTPAPALGEHTDAVLGEAGVSPAEIAVLRESAIIL